MKDGKYKSSTEKVSLDNSESEVTFAESIARGQHKLATIMFSDICGFTKMMGADEKRGMQVVEQNKLIHQRLITNYNGTLIKEMGDGLLASFESAHDAVHCAKLIMEQVVAEEDYQLHIGIHLGDMIFTEEDVYGDGVNIAARLNAMAQAGEIIVSDEVWKIINNPPEFNTQYLGKRKLKNVPQLIKIYKVLLVGERGGLQLSVFYYSYKKAIISGLVISFILIAVLLFHFLSPITGSLLRDNIQTIAVLPFENRSVNEDYEYLSEGLAEDVIGELLDLSSLTVISSRSSFQYKNSDKSIRQISKDLRADIILTGNFSVVDNRLEVKIEVIEGLDDNILDYDIITGDFNNINAVSAEIGRSLFATLEISEEKSDKESFTKHDGVNIEAYKLNAMGRSAMYDHTGQKRNEIVRYFQAAIAVDSNYVEPYLGLAEAYIFDVNRGYISPAEAAQKARQYAIIAEKLRPGSGEVSALLGVINYLNWDMKKATTYFERALELSPNYYLTYHYYAFVLEFQGDFAKALALQKKANTIDPLNAFNDLYVAVNYLFQGKLAQAHQIINATLKVEPDHALSLWMKAIILDEEKKYLEAMEVLEEREYGLTTNFVAGYTYAMLGQDEKANIVLENILSASRERYVPPSQLAIVYCGLGEKQKAIEQVEEAFLVHDTWLGYLRYTSFADPIKDNPRYVSLMNSLSED